MKNREIKFRVWEKARKRMNHNIHSINFHENIITLLWGGVYTEKLKNVELLMWTGLKDKNGKEIYEGDIVKWNTIPYDMMSSSYEQIFEVKWDEENAGFTPFFSYRHDSDESWSGDHYGTLSQQDWAKKEDYLQFEVIGNIFENPDLISKGE